MKNISLFVMSAASAVGLAACGDSSASSCGPFMGCGGNVVGTWQIKETCASQSQSFAVDFCPTATADTSGIVLEGSVTFKADMTYTSSVATKGSFALSLPSSCLSFGGQMVTCAQVDQQAKADAMKPDSEFSAAQCSTSSSGCSCRLTLKGQTDMASGTWSTTGNLLKLNNETNEYCVSGSTLHVKQGMGMMVDPSPFDSIILVKK